MSNKVVKGTIAVLLTACVALTGYFYGSIRPIAKVYADEVNVKTSTINVSAEAIIKVKPDVAYINVGVQTENKNLKAAQQENAKRMNEVYKGLEKLKIGKNSIATESYNVYPVEVYNEKDRRSYVTGYKVNNTIKITINSIDMVGEIVDAVSLNGANIVNNIMFGLKDQEEIYLKALDAATKKAAKKAEIIANNFSIKLSSPFNITETSQYQPIYYRENYMSVKADAAPSYHTTPINTGELDIKAGVSLTYIVDKK